MKQKFSVLLYLAASHIYSRINAALNRVWINPSRPDEVSFVLDGPIGKNVHTRLEQAASAVPAELFFQAQRKLGKLMCHCGLLGRFIQVWLPGQREPASAYAGGTL